MCQVKYFFRITPHVLSQERKEPRLESQKSPELKKDFEQFSYQQSRGSKAPFSRTLSHQPPFPQASQTSERNGATPRRAVSAQGGTCACAGRALRGEASLKLARETKKLNGARTCLPSLRPALAGRSLLTNSPTEAIPTLGAKGVRSARAAPDRKWALRPSAAVQGKEIHSSYSRFTRLPSDYRNSRQGRRHGPGL